MNVLTSFVTAVIACACFISCKKNDTDVPVYTGVYVPYLGDSIFGTKSAVIAGPDFSDAKGILTANSQLRILTDINGVLQILIPPPGRKSIL